MSLFSKNFDDRFSILMLAAAGSWRWAIFALGGLCCLFILFDRSGGEQDLGDAWFEKFLILYALIGVLGNWLAALAHALRAGREKMAIILFIAWPVSYLYTWQVLLRPQD